MQISNIILVFILFTLFESITCEAGFFDFSKLVDKKVQKRIACLEGNFESCEGYKKDLRDDLLLKLMKEVNFDTVTTWPPLLSVSMLKKIGETNVDKFLSFLTRKITDLSKKIDEVIISLNSVTSEMGAERVTQLLTVYTQYKVQVETMLSLVEDITNNRGMMADVKVNDAQIEYFSVLKNFFSSLDNIEENIRNDKLYMSTFSRYQSFLIVGSLLQFDANKTAIELNSANVEKISTAIKGYFGIGFSTNFLQGTATLLMTVNMFFVLSFIYMSDFMNWYKLLGTARFLMILQVLGSFFFGLFEIFNLVSGTNFSMLLSALFWVSTTLNSMEAMNAVKEAFSTKKIVKLSSGNQPIAAVLNYNTKRRDAQAEWQPTKISDQGKLIFRVFLQNLSWLLMSRIDNIYIMLFGCILTFFTSMMKDRDAPKRFIDFVTNLPILYAVIKIAIVVLIRTAETQNYVISFVLNFGLIGSNVVPPAVLEGMQNNILLNMLTFLYSFIVLNVLISFFILLTRAISYKEINVNLTKLFLTPWVFKSKTYNLLIFVIFLMSNNRWWFFFVMVLLTVLEKLLDVNQMTLSTEDIGLDFLLKIFIDSYDEISPVWDLLKAKELLKVLEAKIRAKPTDPKAKLWREQAKGIKKKIDNQIETKPNDKKKETSLNETEEEPAVVKTAITNNKLLESKFKKPVYTTVSGERKGTGVVVSKGKETFYVTNAHCVSVGEPTTFQSPHTSFKLDFKKPTYLDEESDLAFFKANSKLSLNLAEKLDESKPVKLYAVVNGKQVESRGKILNKKDGVYSTNYSNVKGTSGGYVTQLQGGRDVVVGINCAENTEKNENYFIGLDKILASWPLSNDKGKEKEPKN